jgi:dUTP pyrophosphatase
MPSSPTQTHTPKDEDYRGNVGVILFNHSDVEFVVSPGDRIAQLILEVIQTPAVEKVEDLESTERGAGGFGSTGVGSGGDKKQKTGE